MMRITKVDIRIVLSPTDVGVPPVGKSMKVYLEGRGKKSRWLVPEEEQGKDPTTTGGMMLDYMIRMFLKESAETGGWRSLRSVKSRAISLLFGAPLAAADGTTYPRVRISV